MPHDSTPALLVQKSTIADIVNALCYTQYNDFHNMKVYYRSTTVNFACVEKLSVAYGDKCLSYMYR